MTTFATSVSRSTSDVGEESDFEFFQVVHDPIQTVLKEEAYCFDAERFAERLVKVTCDVAVETLTSKRKPLTVQDVVKPIVEELVTEFAPKKSGCNLLHEQGESGQILKSPSSNSFSSLGATIEWPRISEFNIKSGLEKVEECVATWERVQDWQVNVEFLGFESEDCSNYFVYEVEWSQPVNLNPIPQATASVYFTLEVSKVVPSSQDRRIDVSYVFECSNVIHVPGKRDFQEKWLSDIIDAKLRFYRTISF